MKKLTFEPPKDGQVHTYCYHCDSEMIEEKTTGNYSCKQCGKTDTRALIVDPAVWQQVNKRNNTLWHATASIFVVNDKDEILFFKRNRHPLGLTMPAGHLDAVKGEREKARLAACRELREETQIVRDPDDLVYVTSDTIRGDECRRGADCHVWYIYAIKAHPKKVILDPEEGRQPMWLTANEALKKAEDLTFGTRYILKRHAQEILKAVQ